MTWNGHALMHLVLVMGCSTAIAQTQPETTAEGQSSDARVEDVDTWALWNDWEEKNTPDASWEFRFEPSVWYASPGGNLRLPGALPGSDRVRFADLNLDSPRLSAFPELHYRTGLWRFGASGFDVRLEREAVMTETGALGPVSFSPGDVVMSEFSLTSLEVEAGYLLLDSRHSSNAHRRTLAPDLEFLAEGIVGLRGYHTMIDIDNAGMNTDESQTFAHPYVGVRTELVLSEGFSMDLRASAGWFGLDNHSSFSWDALVGFRYYLSPNLALQVGYRQNAYGMSDGTDTNEFSLRGATAGFYAGGVLRF